MKLRQVSPITKTEAKSYAVKILETEKNCKVKAASYIGGGSFGYVYKLTADKEPYNFILKACRTPDMARRESMALELLGKDSLIKIPKVYFTFFATQTIPIDFICMEFMPGKNCFTDFTKLLKSKATKRAFADMV